MSGGRSRGISAAAYFGAVIEPSKEASQRQRRVNWVGLRTMRQRPKLVGATDDGEPIYEVRAVRLVLLGTSPHFTRLAPCSRCGRELPGAPVLTPADLDIELRPMICADCIRGTGITSVWDPEAARRAARGQEDDAEGGTDLGPSTPAGTQEPLSPVPDGAPPVAAAVAAADADVADADVAAADRLAAMERHLGAVTARVNELGRRWAAQQAQSEERRRREAEVAAARDAVVDRALAEIRADLESSLAADRTADGRAIEDRLSERLTEIRAELGSSLGADVRALEDRLNERLVPRSGAPAPPVAGDGGAGVAALEDRVREGMAGLADVVAAQRAELDAVVARVTEVGSEVQRLSQTAGELARGQGVLERRVAEAPRHPAPVIPLVDVEPMLHELMERQRAGLEAAVEASVVARTAGLVRANDELASEQTVLDRRLEVLSGQLERLVHRLEELAAWTDPAGERLEALERAVQHALRSRPVRHEASPHNGGAEAPRSSPPAMGAASSGSLLESLERQLEAAAGRLAARCDPEPEH